MSKKAKTTPKPQPAPKAQPVAETALKTSKKQVVLDLLKQPGGGTIAALEKATGWQQHSVRGALVNLKNRDKQPIESEKRDGVRYYFLTAMV
jgi:C-terminal processing protease CtpA/Prc